jgi:hypothetical protein
MMSGHDSSFSTGRMIAFTNPRITAITANTVHPSPATRMPGPIHAATNSENPVIIQRISSFIAHQHTTHREKTRRSAYCVAGQPDYYGLSKTVHWREVSTKVLSERREERSGSFKDAALSSVPLAQFALFPAVRSPPACKLAPRYLNSGQKPMRESA